MDIPTLHYKLSKYPLKTHYKAQERLMEIGEELGYYPIYECEVPNLVKEGRTSRIDVVWRSRGRNAVAFEVKMKWKELDLPTTEKDRKKLTRLDADEKFLINASRKTGKTYIFKMDEYGEWL